MHPVPHNKPKVRISDENGVVIISDRQSEAFDQLCAHYPLPTDDPFQWSHWVNFEIQQYDARSKTSVGPSYEYVLRVRRTAPDQITTSITPPDLRCYRRYIYPAHHFRKHPVPGTGRRKKRFYTYRAPKRYAEARELSGALYDETHYEYNIRVRVKRRSLPPEWEDVDVPYHKSWKKHRKTQQSQVGKKERRGVEGEA